MARNRQNLNIIYISDRMRETLRPIASCALTAVVAPMGYGSLYGSLGGAVLFLHGMGQCAAQQLFAASLCQRHRRAERTLCTDLSGGLYADVSAGLQKERRFHRQHGCPSTRPPGAQGSAAGRTSLCSHLRNAGTYRLPFQGRLSLLGIQHPHSHTGQMGHLGPVSAVLSRFLPDERFESEYDHSYS